MLKTVSDIQTAVLVRNNRTTTDSFITDATLNNWLQEAHEEAAGFHKWPFTQGRQSTTFAAVEEWNFEGYRAGSFRFIQIGGYRLQKLNFEDYQNFKELNPGSNSRVYSEYGRTIYINTAIDVGGTLTVYGHYTPIIDPTDKTAQTVFTGYEQEGNEAIYELMTAKLKDREHRPDETVAHMKEAERRLDNLYTLFAEDKFAAHTKNRDMFKRFDVLRGGFKEDIFRRDQF